MRNILLLVSLLCISSILATTTPSFAIEGEFKNFCANSLANSRIYQTKCEINETIDGKFYCFGSENSKVVFMKDPKTNLKKAQDYFASLPKK